MEIPLTLRKRLVEGKVIPFVGAGVSMAVAERESGGKRLFPSWNQLLVRAADRLVDEGKLPYAEAVRGLVGIGDYLDAAKRARQGLASNWFDFLKEQFDHHPEQADDESLSLARGVWGLGSRLVVTTNYDRVLHWAHPQPNNLRYWNIEAPAEQVEMLRGELRNPTVWHLHGLIDHASTLILTPDGYSLLYPEGSAETDYSAALQTLRTVLTSHSLLFVGFSMEDERFGLQLKRVRDMFEGAPGPHYVLIPEAERARIESLDLPVDILPVPSVGQHLLDALTDLGRVANGVTAPPDLSIGDEPAPKPTQVNEDPVAPAPVFSVPFESKGDDVIGREAALDAVRKQLVEGRRTQIGQTAAFRGLGGLGKTQLAVEYAYRYRDEYPGGVIWLTADQDIDAQLTELAPKAGWIAAESEHKYKLDVAMQRLRTHTGLLVFDNVETRKVIEPYLPSRETGAHILLTSRTEQSDFVAVPLDLLDMEQSLVLLTREAGREPESAAEEGALREIAERLGGLPLALELAGAFIRHREIGWCLYRDRLSQNPRKALPGKFLQSSTEHESDLYSTLKIDEEVFKDEPLLRDVLDVLAWSGPAPMGISLLSALLALDDPTELSDALGLGVALRLLQKTPGTDSYAIHRLVSQVWRESHPINERREWVEANCCRIGDWFQERKEDFLDLPIFEAEIDHLRAWQEHTISEASGDSIRLLWLQAYPPYHRGQLHSAQDYVCRALLAMEAQPTGDRELLAHLLHDSACTASALGEARKALEYDERALAIRQELFGEQHRDTASSIDSLASDYNRLGDYQKDLEYAERALLIRTELFGERHRETATSLGSVGITYNRLGDYKKALEHTERALAIRKELLGERHPSTAASLDSVAGVYNRLGDYQKDLEYAERALLIRTELFGERHPETADSLQSVGATYNQLGDYEQALEYTERALAIRMELFGERHPDSASSLASVGSVYRNLREYEKALEYIERALAIRRELFGEQHPDVAMSLHNVGQAYGNQGNHWEALEKKRQALDIYRQAMGEGHPYTVAMILSLSSTLRSLNKAAEAFDLIHGLFRRLDRTHPSYSAVQQHLNSLSRQAVRPGFRQPSTDKQGSKKKGKQKKKR